MSDKNQKPGKLKQAVLNWLGFGLTDYDNWSSWYGTTSSSGATVNSDKVLTLSAAWSCVRLISQTIATLPIGVYEKMPDGSRRPADTLSIARVISVKPSADTMAVTFWESLIAHALLHGNGFAAKRRVGGRIVALDLLEANKTTWRKLVDGSYQFQHTNGKGQIEIFSENDIFHIPGFSMGGRFGMSAIKYGAEVFGSALSSNAAANATFNNGLHPTTYFKFDRVVRKDQRDKFREDLQSISGALNAGKSPLLEAGMDIGTVGINPDDAQLLESRMFSVEDVCRWFGVPPSMVGATDKASSWASSSEQLNLWFLQYGLRTWIKRIEQAILTQLLTPAEQVKYYAEYSVEGLLRADTASRTAFYSTGLQNGWMSRNEVRRLENLAPIDGGDIYTVQSNLMDINSMGSQTDAQSEQVRQALLYWLKEPRNENETS